jgi:hypothetical protein
MSKKKKAAERESGRASAQNAVRATLARVVRNEIGNQKSVQAKNTKCGALAREAPPAQKNDHGKAGRLADTDGREMNLAGKSAHG